MSLGVHTEAKPHHVDRRAERFDLEAGESERSSAEQSELGHYLERRGMQRVAAKVAQEVRVLLERQRLDAGPREQQAEHHAGGTAAGNDYASSDLTLSGFSGARRARLPVASNNAFATAAGITRIVGSPAPVGAISGRSISTTSIDSGASCISRIG